MSYSFKKRLETIPSDKIVFFLTGVAASFSIIIFFFMWPVEEALKSVSGFGVLELEFAWTTDRVKVIFDAWGVELINKEHCVTILDFGFLISYSTFLACFTILLSRKVLLGRIKTFGFHIAFLAYIAAIFDAIENVNLILMLTSPTNFPNVSPLIASFFASLKFGIIIIIGFFWIISIFWTIINKMFTSRDNKRT